MPIAFAPVESAALDRLLVEIASDEIESIDIIYITVPVIILAACTSFFCFVDPDGLGQVGVYVVDSTVEYGHYDARITSGKPPGILHPYVCTGHAAVSAFIDEIPLPVQVRVVKRLIRSCPGAGIWYPAANADKTADPALVETLGLLYDAATAFGVKEITLENAASFEGTQGICPEGWHLPTAVEMTGLVGHCTNAELINTEAPYYDATIKGASLAALKEAGWEWTFASCRNKTSVSGNGSYLSTTYDGIYGVMSYLLGSTFSKATTNDDGSLKNAQYYYMMPTYNASNEKVAVAYGNFLSGVSVRCVKDKE